MTTEHEENPIDIDCGTKIPFSIAFREDGSQLVGGGIYFDNFKGWLDRWLVKDGHEVPGTQLNLDSRVYGVITSKDGNWIVNVDGKTVEVRDAETSEQQLQVKDHTDQVLAIDVSNDSQQFASGSMDKTVITRDITTGKILLGPLPHDYPVLGVKYSPSGEYIAAAASGGDAEQAPGHLIVWRTKYRDKPVTALSVHWRNISYPSTPLAWSSDSKNLFYIAYGKITCITISTSKSSEWPVPTSLDVRACSLATNGKFIACSAGGSISFWDPVSHSQTGSTIKRDGIVLSLALSPDNSHLACGTILNTIYKIGLYTLGNILSLHVLVDPGCRLPLMSVSGAAFKPWIEDDLTAAEEILSQEIASSTRPSYHALANRALVRARLRRWPQVVDDAKASLSVRSSPIGHVAHAVALFGQGERARAFSAFDPAFCKDGADHTTFLSLIKALLKFVSGDQQDAIADANDIVARADDHVKYDYLQVLGAMYREQGIAERAEQTSESARSFSSRKGFHLVTISLIFGKTIAPLPPVLGIEEGQ